MYKNFVRTCQCSQARIVYVYEEITNANGSNKLVNEMHFRGIYEGKAENEKLRKEASNYLEVLRELYVNETESVGLMPEQNKWKKQRDIRKSGRCANV